MQLTVCLYGDGGDRSLTAADGVDARYVWSSFLLTSLLTTHSEHMSATTT